MSTTPKQLLETFALAPKKSLGQNFLHDPNTLARIIESADLPPNATVLEIGPGTGALTRLLANHAARVVCVETDMRLQPVLEQQLQGLGHVEIHWGDFLKVDMDALLGDSPYYVVANLPYYITSAIIRRLFEAPNPPHRLVLTVQKEVAERILAKPGDMSLLSVSVQFYGEPQWVMTLNPAVFWPRPDVESAVIRIDVYEHPNSIVSDIPRFFQIVRAGFSQKRKQLKNALAGGLGIKAATLEPILTQAGIDPSRRAETLSLPEWEALYRAFTQI